MTSVKQMSQESTKTQALTSSMDHQCPCVPSGPNTTRANAIVTLKVRQGGDLEKGLKNDLRGPSLRKKYRWVTTTCSGSMSCLLSPGPIWKSTILTMSLRSNK